MFYILMQMAYEQGLLNSINRYAIIPGYYANGYEIEKDLESFFKTIPNLFMPFDSNKIDEHAIEIIEEHNCHRFAFDANTGKFVTDKILFGKEYYNINNSKKI